MKMKWYLPMLLICLILLSTLFIESTILVEVIKPCAILGIILVFSQILNLKKIYSLDAKINENLKDRVLVMENKLSKSNQTIQNNNNEISKYKQNNDLLNNEIQVLTKSLEEANQNISKYKQDNGLLNNEIQVLTKSLEEANQNISKYKQNNDLLNNEIQVLTKSLEEANQNNNNEISKYKQNNDLLNNEIQVLTKSLEEANQNNNNEISEYKQKIGMLNNNIGELKEDLKKANQIIQNNNDLKSELCLLEEKLVIAHYKFSDYDALTSQECKNRLSLLKEKQTNLIKDDKAIDVLYIYYTQPKKAMNNNIKKILRNFNADCDNVLLNLKVKNIDSCRSKIQSSYNSLNKIFEVEGISISMDLLSMKLEELNLVYTFELKKQQEIEQQKAIKEQMIEEEKARKEIANEKLKLEKEESQFKNEVNKLISYMQKTNNDIEKTLYLDKIKELEEKLSAIEKDKVNVLERETNTRAGFVYIISNIGSFGENIYKIGMTRRLEPMDRIHELGNASVPFPFDVHAIIFSDDAPSLENLLHKRFEKNSVNKVNLRKEFFEINLEDVKKFVFENFNNTVEFTLMPIAEQYHESINIKANAA